MLKLEYRIHQILNIYRIVLLFVGEKTSTTSEINQVTQPLADHRRRLNDNMKQCGLRIRRDVSSDGNCLYSCISDQMLRLQQAETFIPPQQWRDRLFAFLNQLVRNGNFAILRYCSCTIDVKSLFVCSTRLRLVNSTG
jgi:hypothetical protein